MRTKREVMSLKQFLEALQQQCSQLSHEELSLFISEIAKELKPLDRKVFLDRLISWANKEEIPIEVDFEHELIKRFYDLKESIAERTEKIENGSYYDEYYDEYYDDEEPDTLSEEQREELELLFAEADSLFLSNQLELAGKIYGLLFGLFRSDENPFEDEEEYDEYDEYDEDDEGYEEYHEYDEDEVEDYDEDEEEDYDEDEDSDLEVEIAEYNITLNWRETRARYCRAVYETTPPEKRINQMMYALEIYASSFRYKYDPANSEYPFLKDVYEAREGELSDWTDFLKQWRQALEGEKSNRAYILFLEAVHWLEGLEGVVNEVRKHSQPLGYHFWLDKLAAAEDWQEAAIVGQEAVRAIPEGDLRTQAAEILTQAAKEIGDYALILDSFREQFFSSATDSKLALLLQEARKQGSSADEQEKVLASLNEKKKPVGFRVKLLLMMGRADDAVKLIGDFKPLGWSSGENGQGLFFAGLLIALSQGNPEAAVIHGLLKRYVITGYSYSDKDGSYEQILCHEIVEGLKGIEITESQAKRWFNIARKACEARVDAIVSNQHRGSYNKAAELLGALMECYILNGQQSEAKSLLNMYRNVKYKRHIAFKREVDAVINKSKLLRTEL